MTFTFDQPQLVPAPRFEATRFESKHAVRHNVSQRFSWDVSNNNRSRNASLAKLSRPRTSHSQAKSRPIIGAPMDFRRVTEPMEPMPVARRSFRPLELSIYISNGRISPLPDFDSEQWTSKLPELQRPQSAVLRRETMDNSELPNEFRRKPLSITTTQNLRRDILSEPSLSMGGGPGPIIRRDTMESMRDIQDLATIDEDRTPTLNHDEDMPGLSRPWTSYSGVVSPPLRMGSLSPFSLGRSRSKVSLDSTSRNGSVRRLKDETIDDAIRELNTIVEQKRVKEIMGARDSMDSAPLSPTSHVPAIAPSMRLRARSSTLTDIGSAFSISYADKPMPAVPSPSVASTSILLSRSTLPALRLATSDSPAPSSNSSTTAVAHSKASTKSRLSTWFRRSMSASPATPTSQTFYQMTPSASTSTPGLIQDAQQGGHVRNSSSLSSALSDSYRSSLSTRASSPYPNSTATPATTIAGSLFGAPTTPDESFPPSRPSTSKTPKTLRRMGPMKRGLSIDTTLSNGSVLAQAVGPPAYEEIDSNPNTGNNDKEVFGPLTTPSRVGVAF